MNRTRFLNSAKEPREVNVRRRLQKYRQVAADPRLRPETRAQAQRVVDAMQRELSLYPSEPEGE